MLPEKINGSEEIANMPSAMASVIQFYKAFNHQDLQMMSNNWLHSSHATMANPLGGIKHGWDEIESVYKNIFYGKARVFVEFYDFEYIETDEMFYIAGRERGELGIDNKRLELKIRTSRIFSKQQNGWKQIHHHGSMDDPLLLADYQATVLNINKDKNHE